MRGEEVEEVEEVVPWEEVVEEGVALGRGGGRGGGRTPGGPDSWEMGECAGPHKHSCQSHSCIKLYTEVQINEYPLSQDRLHNLLDIRPTVILFHSSSGSAIRQFLVTS